MGLNLCKQATTMASCIDLPGELFSIPTRSSNTMALLITIPAKEITPKNGMNPNGSPKTSKPTVTPMIPNGIVKITMGTCLKELNCIANKRIIINPDKGK